VDPSLMRKLFFRTGIEFYVLYVIAGTALVALQNWWNRNQPAQKRWRYGRVMIVGVGLLVLFLAGSHVVAPRLVPERTWTPFTSKEGRFTVSFPGAPQDFLERRPYKNEYRNLYTFAIPGGWTGVTYTMSYMDTPTEKFDGGPRGALEGIRNTVVSGAQSQLLSSAPITFAGQSGIEFTYRNLNGIGLIRARVIISGKRIYMQWAGPLADPKTDPNGTEFFKSLKLKETGMGPFSEKTDK